MKKVLISGLILILCAFFILGCGSQAATTTSGTTSAPSASQTSSTSQTPSPAGQPVYGGTMKVISGSFPKILGYPPEFAPNDSIYSLPVLENLNEWDEHGKDTPVLAESWTPDPENKTLTWHLRQGVKFQDGTPFNAEAVKWNFQLGLDAGTLTDGDQVESLEVVDEYTLRMHLLTYNRFMPMDFGWLKMISPTAFETAGGTIASGSDLEASKAWARMHSVGTGPFTVSKFERDTSMTFVKNPNYWRQGMPYLDGIELTLIPDVMSATATMQAGQADMWASVTDVQSIINLKNAGLVLNYAPSFTYWILPNSSDPASPYSKLEVREALEYAINRPALAEKIGSGQYTAMDQMIPAGTPGNVPGYDPRPYNPDKAKELLAAAGYPNGFKTSLLVMQGSEDTGASIKAYLDAVGIQTTVDVADMGRYFGAVFGGGWSDLAFAAAGGGSNISIMFDHFGPYPKTFKSGNIYKSPEYLALCNQVFVTYDDAKATALVQEAVKQAGSDAMVVPVYESVLCSILQTYAHSDFSDHLVTIVWHTYSMWLDKH